MQPKPAVELRVGKKLASTAPSPHDRKTKNEGGEKPESLKTPGGTKEEQMHKDHGLDAPCMQPITANAKGDQSTPNPLAAGRP